MLQGQALFIFNESTILFKPERKTDVCFSTINSYLTFIITNFGHRIYLMIIVYTVFNQSSLYQ
jgi:hypothetical protein